jgi:hypothetical protein
MRERPHDHPCQRCGVRTPCTGELQPNHDGFPIVICRDFHLEGGQIDDTFLCAACAAAIEVPYGPV